MWRGGARLPLWLPGVLTGARPGAHQERCEEAVLVTFSVPEPARVAGLATLEDAVDQALADHGTGELEAVQPGPGRITVLAYGADADRVWASIEAAVRAFPCRPAEATLRYGPVGAPDRTCPL
jgi:hypothetical protein